MLDNVTINQLRAFVAVCDQGSFSGAARELRRAQSAISHAIKALESAFDVELFERNTRKATLTAAGRSLLPDARAVISRTEEMKTRAVSIAEAGVPQVSIAVDTYFPRAHLIECLRSLQADFPTVAINLRITTMQGGEYLKRAYCDGGALVRGCHWLIALLPLQNRVQPTWSPLPVRASITQLDGQSQVRDQVLISPGSQRKCPVVSGRRF